MCFFFKYDTWIPNTIINSLDEVKKMLIFIQPGIKDVKGAIYIDDIMYSPE